jgi:hypothetical protein
MQTVVKEEYKTEIMKAGNQVNGDKYSFEVYGQTVDMSCEDRDVYFNFPKQGWLNGEDAIKLGQLLIKHGTKALIANRVNWQCSYEYTRLKKFITEHRVKELTFTVVDEHPANYGDGQRTYCIVPTWYPGEEPKYEEAFSFEQVISWSPNGKEFEMQLARYTVPIKFVGYDWDAEVKEFKKACKMCGGCKNTADEALPEK